ncbi:Alpha/Beta hydrolase protein [Trichophaea hybrida]|nr:Alpha/Beta hydrolase protein [Trichophaea hybrida]
MAANPPGELCGVGHIHEGTRKVPSPLSPAVSYPLPPPFSPPLLTSAHPTSIVNTYITGTPCPPGRLIAAAGYYVIMPDLFNGDPWPFPPPEGLTLSVWLVNHMPEQTMPIVDAVLKRIKTELKPDKIGAVGYCFGAKYVARLLVGDIDAGFNAHPSFVTMEELAAIKGPMSIAAAETDDIFTTELRHQSEAKLAEIGATYQINLFSGVTHGFAVRGDLSAPQVKWAKEKAFEQAVEWFKFHLSG